MKYSLIKLLIFITLFCLVFGGYGACVRSELNRAYASGKPVHVIEEYVEGAFLFIGWSIFIGVAVFILGGLICLSDWLGDEIRKASKDANNK